MQTQVQLQAIPRENQNLNPQKAQNNVAEWNDKKIIKV